MHWEIGGGGVILLPSCGYIHVGLCDYETMQTFISVNRVPTVKSDPFKILSQLNKINDLNQEVTCGHKQ